MMSKNIPRIKGEKVNLCLLRTDDEAINIYVRWLADENIAWRIGANNDVTNLHDEAEWAKYGGTKYRFNIVTRDNDTLIGNCEIRINNRNATLGILIGDEINCECGYGTETLKILLKFCFEELGLHNVALSANSDNGRAIYTYKKIGFKECGCEREVTWLNDHWVDNVTFQILEDEYRQLYKEDK